MDRAIQAVKNAIEGLSLRQRFQVAPLLGLIVMALLTAAFVFEARRQNELLNQLAGTDLAYFNSHAADFETLTRHHLALYSLLSHAQAFDEGELYDQSKALLYRIQDAVDRMEALQRHEGEAGGDHMHADDLNLLSLATAYREAATSAIAMTTVDLRLAPAQLELASQRFVALSEAQSHLLEEHGAKIDAKVAARIHRSSTYAMIVAAGGIVAAILLYLVARVLSQLLGRSLETQIEALSEIGGQAGAKMAVEGRTEMERIAHATAAFRGSLTALRRAHDELEERVEQRTMELRQANQELVSEVELRKAAEDRLRIYGEVIRSTGEAVAITDIHGRIVEVNPAYQRATGRSRDESIGTPLHLAGRDPHPEDFYQELWRDLLQNGYWTGELLERRSNGESYPTWALVNAVRDAGGALLHYVCVSRDITDLKRNEQELKRLAFNDSLTGLPNRALFHDRLDVALAGAERDGTVLGVMFIDLDRFKYVNDTLGHAAGDQLLIEVSRRIGDCLRAADTLARMGGDEFTVLLGHLGSAAESSAVAERIIRALQRPVVLGEETVYIGASIGLSFYPSDALDAETLQKCADMAMYEAKEAGRGQYREFSPDMLARTGQHLKLSTEIERAFDNDEFSLVYLPIFDADGDALRGMEALIRWERDGVEVAPPSVFLPHAEESGLIKKIDCWVLEKACREALGWAGEVGDLVPLNINLSVASIQQPDMAGLVKRILQQTNFPPSLLSLEIAEASVRLNPNTVQAVLEELTSIGIRISVNDFGTSYAALNYLSQFPISGVKLNHHFIDRVGRDKSADAIVRSLLELASHLNLTVVANGIERNDQETFLREAGCGMVQGHMYARPLHGEGVADWLSSRLSAKRPTRAS